MPEKQDLIEGLLFLSGEQGLDFTELVRMLKIDPDELYKILEKLLLKYEQGGFHLYRFGETFKFLSDPNLEESFTRAIVQPRSKNLSQASLEILSIVAYQQPISRLEIQKIRGVNCDSTIKTLINLGLIQLDNVESGRAYQYRTTDAFLEYMGLESLDNLPALEVPFRSTETQSEHTEEILASMNQTDSEKNEKPNKNNTEA